MSDITPRYFDPIFKHALSGVYERDIDLLLLEEFNVNDDFGVWFCAQIGLESVIPDGAWRGLSNSYGETDLLLRVRTNNENTGILIENKISAPEQVNQSERYRIRGAQYAKKGAFNTYKTILCAPALYISGLNSEIGYDSSIEYEKISAWFASQPGKRNVWRSYVINQAILQARQGYVMLVDEAITKFQKCYWEHLKQFHPNLKMAEPKNKGGRSNWIILKGHNFPTGVQLHHKFNNSEIELAFLGRQIEDLNDLKENWAGKDFQIARKGETASIVIKVPPIDIRGDFESQRDNVEKAMQDAEKLLPYASIFVSNKIISEITKDL